MKMAHVYPLGTFSLKCYMVIVCKLKEARFAQHILFFFIFVCMYNMMLQCPESYGIRTCDN